MTLTKTSANLLRLLALSLLVAPFGWSQTDSAKKPNQDAKRQSTQAPKPGAKPAPAPAAKTASPAASPAKHASSPPAHSTQAAKKSAAAAPAAKSAKTPAAKPPVMSPAQKKVSKPAAKQARPRKAKSAAKKAASATPPSAKAAKPGEPEGGRKTEIANKRDPFVPLIDLDRGHAGPSNLPPGKAGLVVGTLRVDGSVRSEGGMIAVVSNPDQRVYFIREGDRLFDGDVEKIDMDGVTFHVNTKDAFGRPIERVVTKRIYARAGEQQ